MTQHNSALVRASLVFCTVVSGACFVPDVDAIDKKVRGECALPLWGPTYESSGNEARDAAGRAAVEHLAWSLEDAD